MWHFPLARLISVSDSAKFQFSNSCQKYHESDIGKILVKVVDWSLMHDWWPEMDLELRCSGAPRNIDTLTGFSFALRHVVEWADENQRPYNPPHAWSASPERKYRVLDVDIPTSKRPIYSRSSYPSVPLLSLIVSPASEQRPKSLVRSELSTPVYLGCGDVR